MQNNHKKAFIIAEIGNNHEGCLSKRNESMQQKNVVWMLLNYNI